MEKSHLASGRSPTRWTSTPLSKVSGFIFGHGTRNSSRKGRWDPKHFHWLCCIAPGRGGACGVESCCLPEHKPKFALVPLSLLYCGAPESHASLTVQSTLHPLHGDKFHNDLRSGTELETRSPPQLQVFQGPQGLQTPFVPFPRVLRGPLSPTSSSPTFKARASESHPSGAFNSAHCPRGFVA